MTDEKRRELCLCRIHDVCIIHDAIRRLLNIYVLSQQQSQSLQRSIGYFAR